MSSARGIGWVEESWNPTTGRTKISPGCAHCWAERMAWWLQGMGQQRYVSGFRVAHREIPWENLAKVRDRTEPELFKEDPLAMWEIGTDEFPVLVDKLEALLPAGGLWRYRADDDV